MNDRLVITNTNSPSKFALQRGCFFKRVAPEAIRVWRRAKCFCCGEAISLSPSSVYCRDDKEPLLAGLLRVVEGDMPPEGYSLYSGSMPHCGRCAKEWRSPVRGTGPLREPFRE